MKCGRDPNPLHQLQYGQVAGLNTSINFATAQKKPCLFALELKTVHSDSGSYLRELPPMTFAGAQRFFGLPFAGISTQTAQRMHALCTVSKPLPDNNIQQQNVLPVSVHDLLGKESKFIEIVLCILETGRNRFA